MTKLIVWHKEAKRTRKKEYSVISHAQANKLARTEFKGLRTKVVGGDRTGGGKMRTYSNMMAVRGGF